MQMFVKPVLGVGFTILLIITAVVDASFVKLDQNAYENVLVRIADDVPSVDCIQTITNLQGMLQEASNALCTALESRAYLRNVTILIPSHWAVNGNCLVDINITWPRTHMADLIVGQDHPVFGGRSFTLNYGGCGVSSLPVRLPIGYLTAPARGVAVAHEWFHYRYGVFDEIGVGGDPLYPKGYQIKQPEAEFLPTSCTNEPLKGDWLENEWQNGNGNGNITSSLMYSTDLPSINRLCTADNHMKAPPTKHNWLCGSRSVSEIVYSHHDFSGYNDTQAKNCGQTRFSVATNPHQGYHIILDITSAMAVNNLMESALFAASHFIWFLPDGSTVSIDTFSDVYSQVQTPIALNLTTKNAIISHLNRISAKDNTNTAGLSSALNNAIRMYREGLEIILITAAQEKPSNFSVYVDEFRRNLIAPHILTLSIPTSNIFSALARDGWLYFVPVRTAGASIIPGVKYRNAQTWMTDTLHSVYSQTGSYRAKVEEKTLQMTEGWNNGTFQLESPATSLIFAFYHLDDGFSMTFKKGSLLSPSNQECSIVRLNTVFLYSADCGNIIVEKGTWSYFIEVSGSSVVRLDTWFSSNSVSPIRVETWTNSIQNQPIDWKSQRVVLYALVSQQQKAVSGLSLVAYINGDNEAESVFSVNLNENNPSDVTKGDGIYSAQLTNLPRSSIRFSYVVEIVNGIGNVDAGTYNGHPTAGSLIPSSQPQTLSSPFNRYVYGGSFQLNTPYDGRDVLPPGRITDLTINNYDSTNSSVELKWTGPKDDYDASSILVSRFIITDEDDWTEKTELIFYNGTIQPLPGTVNQMTFTVDVPKSNKSRNVFYRVYGLDSSGNQGQSSNIAAVYVLASAVTPTDPADDPSILPPALYWFLIGLACVCVILIAAIIVAFTRRYRDAKRREAMGSDWVKIGETSIEPSKLPESKKETETDKTVEPQVPDFNAYLTPSPRRRDSNEYISSRWSDNSYETTGSEIYRRPQVIFTEARIETRCDSPESPAIRKSLPTYSFGGNWDNVPSPASSSTSTTMSFSSGKKVPPPPPPRKYLPYSSESNSESYKVKTKLEFGDKNDSPLASSPSYLASQLKKQDVSYLERGILPKTYSMQTLASASNSSISRFGIVLGADSEASLV